MPLQNETRPLGAAGLGKMSSFRADNPQNSSPQNFLQAPRFDQRFRRDVEAVHALGPYVLSCLLEEIASGADLPVTVERYARLDGDFIAAHGGGFPSALRALEGGRP
jgi:hypothetical protein